MTLDTQDKKYIHNEIKSALIKNNKIFKVEVMTDVRKEMDRHAADIRNEMDRHGADVRKEIDKQTEYVRKEMGKQTADVRKEMNRQTGILLDQFKSQTQLVAELVTTRPSREEFCELENDVRHLERRVTVLSP